MNGGCSAIAKNELASRDLRLRLASKKPEFLS